MPREQTRDTLGAGSPAEQDPSPGAVAPLPTRFRAWLASSRAARLLFVSLALRGVGSLLQWVPGLSPFGPLVTAVGSIGLLAALGYYLYRLLGRLRHQLLWRVRRKLIVSYLFIGFVPVLLLVAFFTLAGLLLFREFGAYILKSGIDDLAEAVRLQADTAALEIERSAAQDSPRAVLERKLANLAERYPGLSLALMPVERRAGLPASKVAALTVGPWEHLPTPGALPAWVGREGFGGVLAYTDEQRAGVSDLVIRAIGLPDTPDPAFAVIVDVPFDDFVRERLRESTGIRVGGVALLEVGGDESVTPLAGRVLRSAEAEQTDGNWMEQSVAFLECRDWVTGRSSYASIAMHVGVAELYERIVDVQPLLGGVRISRVFLLALVAIAGLFLVIEVVALIMGAALARSITGSIHALSMGTNHVRQGDFRHRIVVRTRDQLGQLAESFNAMTTSIEDLLQQAAEKRRLEEELRIARQIQMSLLPRGVLQLPGITLSALCVPAREVGGDYYDFFHLDDNRMGILIADVAGKGTSAALYMAELKGVVLSLSQIYQSPKRLLKAVNHIISANIDSRSFITMTYAVLDLANRTMTYARAGHTPLIYVPGGSRRRAQILTPDGIVLGLRIDGIEERFDELTVESTLPVGTGDVFVFYTDGITEAMNPEEDLFGEVRLARLVEEHGHLPSDELRERVLREVEAFVGPAEQHDDMTMILLKIEDVEAFLVSAEVGASAGA